MKKALIFSIALISLLLWGCTKEQPVGKRSAIMVSVQPVGVFTPEPIASRYSASIVPDSQVAVTFKVNGYVEQILRIGGHFAQEGDYAARGQVLARVRQSDYDVRVTQAVAQQAAAAKTVQTAKAQLAQAEAARTKAVADFRRAEALYASKSLTRPDYDGARAQLDATEAQVAAARSQIETAEENQRAADAMVAEAKIPLGDTLLVAPVNGIILKRDIEIGTLASPSAPAFEMAEIDIVKAVFGIPDTSLAAVKLGMEIPIKLEALPAEQVSGIVTAISPATDPKTRVFSVEVSINNPKHQIKPGMIVSVNLSGEAEKPRAFTVIPLTAVVRAKDNPNLYSVAVLDGTGASGKVHFRTVSLGDIFGNQVAVLDGLKEGERVVVSGAQQILDGETVQVMQ